jgi:DNA-damage-inducible protein D
MAEEENTQQTPHTSPFDAIRQVDSLGRDYWNAKDLGKLLGYSQFNKFMKVITRAEKACEESGEAIADHFTHVGESIKTGKGARRTFPTVHLSRYACYLVIENSDPDGRPIVALGQTYFAVQTRRQELADEQTLSTLPEDEKRLIYRREITVLNSRLAEAAKLSGVTLRTV